MLASLGAFGSAVGGAGGLLGGLANLGSLGLGLASYNSSGSSTRQAGHQARKTMREEYRLQKNLINYQNEYNSPVNQMKRMQQAGLNPNLMYGAISAGNQTTPGSAPHVQLPSYDKTEKYDKLGNLLSSISEISQAYQFKKMENDLKRDRDEEIQRHNRASENHYKSIEYLMSSQLPTKFKSQQINDELKKIQIENSEYDLEYKKKYDNSPWYKRMFMPKPNTRGNTAVYDVVKDAGVTALKYKTANGGK